VVKLIQFAEAEAISLLADREKPDYPNAIKESISAVEAVVKKVTGPNDDLAAGLKKLENSGLSIHPALKVLGSRCTVDTR
jgi:hypothetical protein